MNAKFYICWCYQNCQIVGQRYRKYLECKRIHTRNHGWWYPLFYTKSSAKISKIFQLYKFYYRNSINLRKEHKKACRGHISTGLLNQSFDWFFTRTLSWGQEALLFHLLFGSPWYIQDSGCWYVLRNSYRTHLAICAFYIQRTWLLRAIALLHAKAGNHPRSYG